MQSLQHLSSSFTLQLILFWLAVLDIGGAFEHKLVLSVVLATFCCPQSSNPSVVYSAIHLQLLEDEDEDEDIESERFSDTVK